jgi:hypothetical protein
MFTHRHTHTQFLEIAAHLKKASFHRNAGHVLQSQVEGETSMADKHHNIIKYAAYTDTHAHAHTHTHTHAHAHTYVLRHIYTKCTCTCTYTYT